MPIPKPNSGETRDKFISRCVVELTDENDFDNVEQRVGVCSQQWEIEAGFDNVMAKLKNKEINAAIDPNFPFPRVGEGESAFVDRCMVDPFMQQQYDKETRNAVCGLLFEESPLRDDNKQVELNLFGKVGLDFDASTLRGAIEAAKGKELRINLFSGGGS